MMVFTRCEIYAAENGYIVTGWSWDSSQSFVFVDWPTLLDWLSDATLKSGPRLGTGMDSVPQNVPAP